MSHQREDEDDLKPTFHAGFKLGEKKTAEELANLDKEDESLAKWKASLGLGPGGVALAEGAGPQVTVETLFLNSPTLPPGKTISLDLTNPEGLKHTTVNIKEGVDFSVGITFKVNYGITSGVRYIQVVKRTGIKVDKLEQMLGSYAPSPDGSAYTKLFPEEESPSGLLARSGSYNVRSRVIDDDGHIYADFEWSFKLTKEW
ncbi:rho GDP-dissociation inhibitor [Serendipita vermifera]|nr:rho GDP-dissociation inhibitor [Serendipita vermifera]